MARTSEMKLHHATTQNKITGETIAIEYFYDTHIRLWTAYARDKDGNASSCGYGPTAQLAIGEWECNNGEGA